MKSGNEKVKADYNTRIYTRSGKQEYVEFDNVNWLEKMQFYPPALERLKETQDKL